MSKLSVHPGWGLSPRHVPATSLSESRRPRARGRALTRDDRRAATRPLFLLVTLRGGAGALSMMVPYHEIEYCRRRPTLAVPPPDAPVGGAIDSTGWDHHALGGDASRGVAGRIDELARGLRALSSDLGSRWQETVVATVTELGRSVAENGDGGTEHGWGGAMFVLGGRVRGGRMYGRWPGLGPARGACVVEPTTDLRDPLTGILVRHSRARQPEGTFPGRPVNPDRWPGVIAELRT